MTAPALTLDAVRLAAREKLKGVCNVYRDCDGESTRFCQQQQYGGPLGIGGAGSGASFHNNWLALRAVHLKMRLIGAHFEADTRFTFFGKTLAMPIMGASVSGVDSFGGASVITEAEFCRVSVLGCNEAGTLGWRGDTYTYRPDQAFCLDAIAEGKNGGVKIVKPREQKIILEFFRMAEQCGATAVGIDVDGCGSYNMNKHNQKVFRKTPAELRELAKGTSLPFIVKGIMCPEDALAAADAGAAAVVVSNHGGRVLDHTPGTADVLPGIRAALGRGRVMLLADGGIRTGYDALKMMGLGADAVLVGRDVVRAAVGGGVQGVRLHMEHLQRTLAAGMVMTGCPTVADISDRIIA